MYEDDGALRYINVDNEELIRGIYVAVRDKDWGTVIPEFLEYECHSDGQPFFLRYRAEHRSLEVDFESEVVFEGDRTGRIRATMRGVANQDMYANRIGFCVLYPANLHGQPITVKTPRGTLAGTFPDRIAPHQPFTNIEAIYHQLRKPDMKVEVVFSGDVFEMEDQRNWTDASYKVYSTPLACPRPVLISRGQSVEQTVEIRVVGSFPAHSAVSPHRAGPIQVSLGESRFPLPDLGVGWNCTNPAEAVVDALDAMRLGHFYFEGTPAELKRVLESQRAVKVMHAPLDIGLILGSSCEDLPALLQEIVDGRWRVQRIRMFPENGYVTTRRVAQLACELVESYGIDAFVGGGSRAYFAHLNRASLPLDMMEFVTFPVTPQVHAFDTLSVMETLEVQTIVVRDAQHLGGARPIIVGPITLRPRFNPEAINPTQSEWPGDPRQQALVAAAWLVGSLARLGSCGAAGATYFDAVGDAGVMSSDAGVKFPVYYVMKAVGEMAHHDTVRLIETVVSDPSDIAVLALANDTQRRVLMANLTDHNQQVALCSHAGGLISVLNEKTYVRSSTAGQWVGKCMPLPSNLVDLSPYAVIQVDWT